jgi:hypothetical protein
MTDEILDQCEKSIDKFKNILPIKWTERGILISEGLLFCSMCDLYNIDYILESGTYNGFSTEIFAKYFPSKQIITIDVNTKEEAKKRLDEYDNVMMVKGDGRFSIKNIIQKNPKWKIGIFIDGPKGIDAVNWGKRFMNYQNVRFVGIHDCHRISYGEVNQTRIQMERYKGLQFYSDYKLFVDNYMYLDKDIIGKKDEEQGIAWYPYKISDDRKIDRSLGSYGMTMGFLLKEV